MTNFRKWFKGECPGGHTSGYYFAHKAWQYRQQEIDQLKAQLNNMEACYIEKKKECEDQRLIIQNYEQGKECLDEKNAELQKRIDGAIKDLTRPCYTQAGKIDDALKSLRGAND